MRFCFWVLMSSLLLAASLSAQSRRQEKSAIATCGPLLDQALKCQRFGFLYKVPFGWVDRTADMQQHAAANQPGSREALNGSSAGPDESKPASSSASETLLAEFERPPGAPGDTINSAVVIASEPLENYRGIKTAADYFGAITELAEQRGFKVIDEPYGFSIGAKQLVRGDFSKERGKLTMCQSSLVVIVNRHILSFTFVGGSQDEVEELVGNLSFAAAKAPAHTPKTKK